MVDGATGEAEHFGEFAGPTRSLLHAFSEGFALVLQVAGVSLIRFGLEPFRQLGVFALPLAVSCSATWNAA